jgi:hypothetical protein
MLPLILVILLFDASGSLSAATVRTHTLATLTEQQACPLLGKRLRFFVQLDSPEADVDGDHVFGCCSANFPPEPRPCHRIFKSRRKARSSRTERESMPT